MERIYIATAYEIEPIKNEEMALVEIHGTKEIWKAYFKSWESILSHYPDYKTVQKYNKNSTGCLYKRKTGQRSNKDRIIKIITAKIY